MCVFGRSINPHDLKQFLGQSTFDLLAPAKSVIEDINCQDHQEDKQDNGHDSKTNNFRDKSHCEEKTKMFDNENQVFDKLLFP